jgi:hypothetical protein
MFCAPRLVFDGTGGVRSHFEVLRSRTRYRRCGGRRVPFSFFASPYSFSAVPTAQIPFSCFLHSRTHFRHFQGRRVPFSCFLRSRNHFRHIGRRWVPFPCFALPDTFSVVPRASDLIFMFCATRLVFGGNVGVRSRFHVLRSRTRYWRCGGRRVQFSCFVLPNSFLEVPRVSGLVCMFCGLVLVFGGTDGVGSRFHVLRCRRRFWRCGGRRVPFSCFALPDTFPAMRRASGPVFMFCAAGLVFDDNEGVGSRFNFLRFWTHFRWY